MTVSFRVSQEAVVSFVLALLLGIVAWTFLEYVIHRFGGHEWKVQTPFRREHLRHHRERLYFAGPVEKATMAALVTALLGVISVPLVGWAHGAVFTASVVASYLGYELVHRGLHVRAPRTAYGRWARRHHLIHHHMRPDANHGVTSDLWDRVFGTLVTADPVRIGAAKAPPWLLDGTGVAVAQDYDLRRPTS